MDDNSASTGRNEMDGKIGLPDRLAGVREALVPGKNTVAIVFTIEREREKEMNHRLWNFMKKLASLCFPLSRLISYFAVKRRSADDLSFPPLRVRRKRELSQQKALSNKSERAKTKIVKIRAAYKVEVGK